MTRGRPWPTTPATPSRLYVPTEVLAVTFTTRAAGEMRTRLRSLGAGGVQARTFHSAALRQLRYFWPRVHGAELPDADRVQARPARAPPPGASGVADRPGDAARPGLRDRVGQGQQRPPRRLRRGSRRRAAARSPATTPRPSPGCSRPTRRSSATRAGWTWRTSCCCAAGAARRGRAGRRPGAPAVQVVRRRRVPGRLAASSPRCSTCGSAAATSCASSATRRRRSTPSPAPTRAYLRDFPQRYPGTTSIELVRNYRSTPQVVGAANQLSIRTVQAGQTSLDVAEDNFGRRHIGLGDGDSYGDPRCASPLGL